MSDPGSEHKFTTSTITHTYKTEKRERENLPTRAYVPSGTAMLKSVGTKALPLAGTLVSNALHFFKK